MGSVVEIVERQYQEKLGRQVDEIARLLAQNESLRRVLTVAREGERVAREALWQIKAYVVDHDEPGHECIQCLVEHEVDAALKEME